MNSLKRKYLTLVKEHPIYFGLKAGFEDLTDLHNEWLKSFLFDDKDQTLLAHRGSFKTTTLAIAFALIIVCWPNKSIFFLRKTDTDVMEIIVQTGKILESEEFKTLVQVLYGVELVLTKSTTSEINTNLKTTSRGSSQLIGMGIGASLTGKHADIVATDDIVNTRDRVSLAERRRTILTYMELQNVKNRGGRFINTGTPWHKDDAISIMPNVQKFPYRDTDLITTEQIAELKRAMTASLFAANYELKHIADKDAMFTQANYTEDEDEVIFNGIAHIDAAYGGEDGTTFTIMKRVAPNRFVGLGKRWDKHVDDCLSEIGQLHQHYQAGTIFCENNADKGYLKKAILSRGIPSKDYHEGTNKFVKISTFLRKHWHEIEWLEGTDDDYINEILDYTENSEHDDSPDSAASIIRILTSGENAKHRRENRQTAF